MLHGISPMRNVIKTDVANGREAEVQHVSAPYRSYGSHCWNYFGSRVLTVFLWMWIFFSSFGWNKLVLSMDSCLAYVRGGLVLN